MKKLNLDIPESIQTMEGELHFHEEVTSNDTAQDILNQFRYSGIPAACIHLNGQHQIYKKNPKTNEP